MARKLRVFTLERQYYIYLRNSLRLTFKRNIAWYLYCDGASFSGNRADPLVVNGTQL